ncbi:hypothetical protein [Aliiglaciecola aliphaticivorans]
MRDPERITELLELINALWSKSPDLRFNQLIYNLQYGYSQKNSKLGLIKVEDSDGFTRTGFDFFNLEDEAFITYLKEVLSHGKY